MTKILIRGFFVQFDAKLCFTTTPSQILTRYKKIKIIVNPLKAGKYVVVCPNIGIKTNNLKFDKFQSKSQLKPFNEIYKTSNI